MTLKELIIKNRSCRGFDRSRKVTEEELREMIDCARLSAASKNVQPMSFYMNNEEEQCLKITENVMMGGALPQLHLPYKGTEPMAYIAICMDTRISEATSARFYMNDVGIFAQSITLAAAEMGLSCLMIGAYDPETMKDVLGIPEAYEVKLMIAIGKSAEECHLVEVDTPEPPHITGKLEHGTEEFEAVEAFRKEYFATVKYYREGDVHYTPKRKLDDIILR